MLHIEPYQSPSEESEGEVIGNDSDKGSIHNSNLDSDNGSESIREDPKLSEGDIKQKEGDNDSLAGMVRHDSPVALSENSGKKGSKPRRKEEKRGKDQRPTTAPKMKARIKSARSVRPMPKVSWQQEHVVSLMNIPPFPTCAKSMRISIPNDTKVESKSRGSQQKIRTRNRTIQASPFTSSITCQTSGSFEKEIVQFTDHAISADSTDKINIILNLLKDVNMKTDEVKEQEDQALKLLEDVSDKQTPFNIDESVITEMRDMLNKINSLVDNKLGPDDNAANIVVFINQGIQILKEQIDNLEQRLTLLSAPVIQSDDGGRIAMSMGNHEITLKEGLKGLNVILQQINRDVVKIDHHISDLEGHLDKNPDQSYDHVLSKVNDIHDILKTGQKQDPVVHKSRTPYTGPCRCASLKNGYPKRKNTDLYVEEQYDLCQKCTNDYRGRVFMDIHSLPTTVNETVHGLLGNILEALECDNNIYLMNYMRKFRGEASGWLDDDFSRCYVALFKCSLGWNNIRCPGVLASYLDINALINFHFKNADNQNSLDLDVLGQLLCRIESSARRKLLNSDNLRTLLFSAVCSRNVTAFRFLSNNFAPLDQIKNGRSVLHEIVYQAFIHKDSVDMNDWNDSLLAMVDVIYERASPWWEWHSGTQIISSEGPAQPEPSTDSSDNDNENEENNQARLIIPKERVEQIANKEDLRQNALRYLLNIKDDSNRCPLVYAIEFGPECIIKKITSQPPYQFIPDPLEFVKCSNQKGFIVENIDGRFAPRRQSIMDRLTLRSPLEVFPVLSVEPFKGMLQDKWQRYIVFAWLWFLLYIYYMMVYTACVVYRPIGYTRTSDMYQNTGDKIRLTGEVMIFFGLFLFIYAEIRDYIRLGWVWPWPWTFHGLPRIVNTFFVIFTITAVILRFTFNKNEDIMLALALLLGWMNSIYFLVLLKPTRVMPYVLHIIFTRDICGNFLIIFVITMVATSLSTYCISQELFDMASQNPTDEGFWFYPYTLYRLIAGVTDTEYVQRSRNKGMGYLLFLLFIWLMVFFLIKVLISMVVHTYWNLKVDEEKYKIWIKAWMVQLTERRILPCMCIQYELTRTCMDNIQKTKLQYIIRYDLRKNPQGKMLEVPQHAVLVPKDP